jgi:hypothetical protein
MPLSNEQKYKKRINNETKTQKGGTVFDKKTSRRKKENHSYERRELRLAANENFCSLPKFGRKTL